MHAMTRLALATGAFLIGTGGAERAAAVTIDFEAPAIATPNAELPGDSFAAQGVRFRTVRLSGTVVIGGTITLTDQNSDLRLYRDASAISGDQLIGPSLGGSSNDLLMSFSQPQTAVSLTSDDMVETPNPIRLIALAATTTPDRYRVIDFVDAQDDAVGAPANLLALAPSESFTLALFEVRSQQEGFDDLSFTFVAVPPIVVPPDTVPPVVVPPVVVPPVPDAVVSIPAPSSLLLLAGAMGSAAAARRHTRGFLRLRRG